MRHEGMSALNVSTLVVALCGLRGDLKTGCAVWREYLL